MENNATAMHTVKSQTEGKVYVSLVHDSAFVSAIEGLQSFVMDNFADCDMAYDWVCEMADISSFVADNKAWDMFYDTWQSAAEDAGVPDNIIAGDFRY